MPAVGNNKVLEHRIPMINHGEICPESITKIKIDKVPINFTLASRE